MLIILAVTILASSNESKITQFDAYRANFNSLSISTKYTYKFSFVDFKESMNIYDAHRSGRDPIASPQFRVDGGWECDGRAEHFIVLEQGSIHKAANFEGETVPPYEAIFDGRTLALIRDMKEDGNAIELRRAGASPVALFGPFEWWQSNLAHIIADEFANISVTKFACLFQGRERTGEMFTKSEGTGETRLEIIYNDNWNYVPNFARIATNDKAQKILFIKDVLIIDVKRSNRGGFYPVEWYERSYKIRDFDGMIPDFIQTGTLAAKDKVKLGHFVVTSYSDMLSDVRISQNANIREIHTSGGVVPCTVRSPTLKQLESQAGSRIDDNKKKNINIDFNELNEFSTPKRTISNRAIILFFVVIMSIFGIIILRRNNGYKFKNCIIIMCINGSVVSGCSRDSAPPAPTSTQPKLSKLSAKFNEEFFLYDSSMSQVETKITIKNLSTERVKLFDIDGGCSCRTVDKTNLPLVLSPSASSTFKILLTKKADFENQNINFKISTDEGTIYVPAKLYMIPSYTIFPDNIIINCYENDYDNIFNLTLRVVALDPVAVQYLPLQCHPDLSIDYSQVTKTTGTLPNASHLKFIDYTYKITLKDKKLGIFKDDITYSIQNKKVASSAIMWNRRSYLSSVPERIFLTDGITRVFLHAHDDEIRFINVLSAPPGVETSLVAGRELLVSRLPDSTNLTEGEIKIQTSSNEHPIMVIPVAISSSQE